VKRYKCILEIQGCRAENCRRLIRKCQNLVLCIVSPEPNQPIHNINCTPEGISKSLFAWYVVVFLRIARVVLLLGHWIRLANVARRFLWVGYWKTELPICA